MLIDKRSEDNTEDLHALNPLHIAMQGLRRPDGVQWMIECSLQPTRDLRLDLDWKITCEHLWLGLSEYQYKVISALPQYIKGHQILFKNVKANLLERPLQNCKLFLFF